MKLVIKEQQVPGPCYKNMDLEVCFNCSCRDPITNRRLCCDSFDLALPTDALIHKAEEGATPKPPETDDVFMCYQNLVTLVSILSICLCILAFAAYARPKRSSQSLKPVKISGLRSLSPTTPSPDMQEKRLSPRAPLRSSEVKYQGTLGIGPPLFSSTNIG